MSDETDILTFRLKNGMVCEQCHQFSKLVQVQNEPQWDAEGFFLGIDALVTYDTCHHQVPQSRANPLMVAALLNKYQSGDGQRVDMNGIYDRDHEHDREDEDGS